MSNRLPRSPKAKVFKRISIDADVDRFIRAQMVAKDESYNKALHRLLMEELDGRREEESRRDRRRAS